MQRTNLFLYKEFIQALYFTYGKSYDAFGYSAGLRAEQVNINGHLVTLDSVIKNTYFKLYPTLHLSYKINERQEIQLNYSKRINRPDADELNPFPEYTDPQNLRAGNPKLLPEIIHSAEFGYKWQNKKCSFVPSLYYRYKTNGFTEVINRINDSVLLATSANLATDRSAGLELIFSVKPVKFFSANLSGNFFYNRIDASNLGYTGKRSIISFSTNVNTAFLVTKSTMVQLSSNYRSARLTAQGKVFPTLFVNTGIRQEVFKKKAALTFTVSGLFASLRDKRELRTFYLKQNSNGRRDARIMYLGASYRFGKTANAPKEDKLLFDNGL